ncbi:SRPBCC family protein [Nonomuraea sp. NPDC049695]|uniref:SRPBCC family protein n=1 Tax=Nonomuraea sp. NPDC049695 TaxID=3154734 RepID=UPI0034400528
MRRRRLYIEIRIKADLEDLWQATQDPSRHQRWDLRFGRIEYLAPRDGRQAFRYATLGVSGVGVSTGNRHGPGGGRTSALRFGSRHPLSPIRAGSGYWRYLPVADGVRFLTSYDYRPRVLPGWVMWWATAWSFDRLRLWLETGRTPERTLRQALTEAGARAASALLAAALLPPLPALAVLAAALALPPLPGTPAARRCLHRPPERDRRPMGAPCPRSSSARSAASSPSSTPSSSGGSASGSTAAKPA